MNTKVVIKTFDKFQKAEKYAKLLMRKRVKINNCF